MLAAVVDDVDAIVDTEAPGRCGSPRAAPVTSVVPGGRRSAMAASASGRSVKRNGKADSGQMRCVTPAMPPAPLALSSA